MSDPKALTVPPSDQPLPSTSASQDLPEHKTTETSDGEAGERPVREKLKKTSIAGLSQQALERDLNEPTNISRTSDSENSDIGADGSRRGRPAKKRSFEDLQQGEPQHEAVWNETELSDSQSLHKRMRSRDVTADKVPDTNGRDPPKTDTVIREENHSRGVSSERMSQNEDLATADTAVCERDDAEDGNQGPNEGILSPRKKRSRDQFDKDFKVGGDGSDASTGSLAERGSNIPDTSEQLKSVPRSVGGEPEKKRHRDASSERDSGIEANQAKLPPESKSSFSNASTTSPFGAAVASKTINSSSSNVESKVTSPSAFALSGISSFASSDKSPFGALGTTGKSGSGFGSSETTSRSGFGSSFANPGFGGTTTFASSGSAGFGGQASSGFGNTFNSGLGTARPLGGLSSFAAPAGSQGILGSNNNSKRVFGAPEAGEEEEEDSEGGDNENDDVATDDRPRDKRFVEQEVETGEESEETVFTCKAKLYHFDGKEWKERGVGSFKVNVSDDNEADVAGKKKARLILRTEGVHRVALNTPIFKDMKVGTNEGKEPTGKMLNLAAMEQGKPVPLLLKTGSLDAARDLYHHIKEIQKLL